MASDILTHQLKSLLDACCQLQQRMGEDAKAAELLYCSRGLLTRLVVEGELGPQLDAVAQEKLSTLQSSLRQQGVESNDPNSSLIPLQQLQALHAALAKNNTPEASALCRQLVKIEADHIDSVEKAFRTHMTSAISAQAAAANTYDKKALADFLAKVFSTPGLMVKSIQVISGGFSKLTLKADIEGGPDIPASIILRCDLPAGKAFVGTLVKDEYPILLTAHRRGVSVPEPYAIDESGSVIGLPFIALSHAAGRTVGTLFEFPPPDADLARDVARQMARIHTIPHSELGTTIMGPEVATTDRIRAEIDKSYAGLQSTGRSSTILEEGFRRLRQNITLADGSRSLVHGDIGLHNMMVDNSKVSALLDWEFGKMGNPADDLGYFYYTADHMIGWDAFLAEYVRAGGIAPPREQIDFYRLLGLCRVCVFCYQADTMFITGKLPQIQYAPPYNVYLRGTLLRAATLLEQMD